MILRPLQQDIKSIGYYLGKVIVGLALTMALPAVLGFALGEINPALDFIIGLEVALVIGLLLEKLCFTDRDLTWAQGMIVVSLSWIAAMVVSAVPLYLSGHWRSFLDTCFETMSGIATTGLALVQDLDHLSYAHNFWRHLIMFIGGQGVVIVALAFSIKGLSGAFKMYVGEARDEKVLPNVIDTARFIWLVSTVYLVLGTLSLGVIGMIDGMRPFNAFFHGACVFMAAFDTGGFTPQSQNVLYYHSLPFEIGTVFFMILGALNFKLHYHLWTGNRREIWRNIETRVLFASIALLGIVVAMALVHSGTYAGWMTLFRKGFFHLVSAHTGTGYQTVYAAQFVREWGPLSLVTVIIAMGLGGGSCSTTGGIKMLRIGLITKAFKQDIKKIMFPERAMVVQKFHHIRDMFLEDKQARSVLLITLAYLILYGLGALIGMACGYPFLDALFESTSAAGNVGLSCGITDPIMPAVLKVTYIVQMWAGRLEFMSVFTLIGFIVAAARGR